jgi:hypothetical protein
MLEEKEEGVLHHRQEDNKDNSSTKEACESCSQVRYPLGK